MKIKPVMSQSYFPRMPCLIRSCNDVRSALGWKNLFASAKSLDICQSWAYWKTEKYLLTTKYQLHECTNCTWGLLGHGDSAWTQNWEPWLLYSYGVLSTDHHSWSIQWYKSSFITIWLLRRKWISVLAAFLLNESNLRREIKFSWLIFSFKS